MKILPVSAIIATVDRRERLSRTIGSIFCQELIPAEIVVVSGGSIPWQQADLLKRVNQRASSETKMVIEQAQRPGAGTQRNQGLKRASQPFIWFLDDDVDLEPRCLATLWRAMEGDAGLGGCNAVITNQTYAPPGRLMRRLLSWLGCPRSGTLAGLCRGPALNFLPGTVQSLENNRVEWLNTTCTLFRRQALPDPPFLVFFHGYSLMEDLALSLHVGKKWSLRSLPEARIYHDSAPAAYKSRLIPRQAMEVTNRWFVARRVMGRGLLQLLPELCLWQSIGLMALLRDPGGRGRIPGCMIGIAAGWWRILRHARRWRGYDGLSA